MSHLASLASLATRRRVSLASLQGLVASAAPSQRQAAPQAADIRPHLNLPLACTGLDARAAAIVMRTVRNIVNTGRTIVCTIHQPSIDIFESFDELLLLKRGGQTIYAGNFTHSAHYSFWFGNLRNLFNCPITSCWLAV